MNYILEGNANFQDSLLKALCHTETIEQSNQTMCLISNQPLDKSAVTLMCNHTFNYIPLFKEVLKQKRVINRLEIQKLKKFQIKCPYCRNVQNYILPYYKQLSIQQIIGVNWPPRYALHPHRCKARFKSGKRKGELCNKPSFNVFCKRHSHSAVTLSLPPHKMCSAILKSGKNKGKQCRYKIKKDGRCGLHQS